jgi:molybdopterin-guanine dinucleotide biosynthesis protein A
MGTSKVWLRCGNEYLLQRMVRIVAGMVHPVVVAARRDQELPDLPGEVEVVYDAVENGGPLAGLAVAFETLRDRCEAAFVTSCDQPLLKTRFVERLIDLLQNHSGVAPEHEGSVHSLTAVYRLDTLSALTAQLEVGNLRVSDFVKRSGVHVIPGIDLKDIDPNLDSLRNVNDPDAFDRILRELGD